MEKKKRHKKEPNIKHDAVSQSKLNEWCIEMLEVIVRRQPSIFD